MLLRVVAVTAAIVASTRQIAKGVKAQMVLKILASEEEFLVPGRLQRV